MTENLAKTPLHAEHQRLGGRMVPFAGYSMPVQFKGVKHEHLAVRSGVGVFDVSHMGELELNGPGAEAVIQGIITNDTSKLSDGQALYTCACKEDGGILDDLIVYRLAAERWIVVCNASNRAKMVAHFAAHAEGRCTFDDASERTALIALQGPEALSVAARLGDDGPHFADLASFGLLEGTLAGVAVIAARTGYTGEDGVELFVPTDQASKLYEALLTEGAEPAGLAARDTLRLEARLSLYGNDIDETTHPYEAGLGWTVKLDASDFVGRDALRKLKSDGYPRRLVGFEMVGRGIARHGYPIVNDAGESIGICTSGSPAPSLGKNIGLGYVPQQLRKSGNRLLIDCRGRHIEAVVTKTPFYKRAAT